MIMFICTMEMYYQNFFLLHFYYVNQNMDREFEVIFLRVK